MNHTTKLSVIAAALLLSGIAAQAQENVVKFGLTRYTNHSSTTGVTGIGIPPGADADVGDATTVIAVYERNFTPNIGLELVLGVPPKIESRATGSVAFLGDNVLSAKNVSPTLLLNYHFGMPGDTWRPYVGAGINYTRFVSVKSKLAPDVKLSDSWGPAAQAGISYAISKEWGLFASVAALKVKSDLVAVGATVLTTTIDYRPIVYSLGAAYSF